jgi:hypothetical protein
MLRAASASYFTTRNGKRSSFEQQATKIINEYQSYSDRRNEIAHGSVQRVFLTEKKTEHGHRQSALGFYLVPSFYNPKKFKGFTFTYRYTSSDVTHYKQEFTKLFLRVEALRGRMAQTKAPRPKASS